MIFVKSLASLTLCGALWGQTAGSGPSGLAIQQKGAGVDSASDISAKPENELISDPGVMAEKWGVEVVAVRLTAADMMLDVRLRVLDAAKADPLFSHRNLPVLLNPATGHKLQVPNTPTTGRLRPTVAPEKNRVYPMLFGNAFRELRHGDKVTLRIGQFEAVGLVIE